MNKQRGTAALETALMLPVLILLLMGTLEIGRIAYTYYAVHKVLYGLARVLGTQQGVNFCDDNDPTVAAAKAYVLNGSSDASTAPLIGNLTADQISVRLEQVDPTSGALSECACSVPGCDTANGGVPPDFIVVSIPNGYPVTPHIPLIPMDPIPLRPVVRVPYGGT
ncbi:MAG: TadE/TadG family type IV pilus assembly protein [Bryobacteraceae bacterium]